MGIRRLLAFSAIIVVVITHDEVEERASTDVSLVEFDLEDHCYREAEFEWIYLTDHGSPYNIYNKTEAEQLYGDTFRESSHDTGQYLEVPMNDTELIKKLKLIITSGDYLITKEHYDKQVFFSNTLQKIEMESRNCPVAPCKGVHDILMSSMDPIELKDTWIGYHKKFSNKIEEYIEVLQFVKEAAIENGESEVNSYWQQQNEFPSGYTDAVIMWQEIEPLYQTLHTFVSKQLSKHYNIQNLTNHTVIPAHLLGSVRGSDWTYIADHVLYTQTYQDIMAQMNERVLGGESLYKTAEDMMMKLGLQTLPPNFWKQSRFHSTCPTSIVNFCVDGETRVVTCNKTGWTEYLDAYETIMRIVHIQLAQKQSSYLFRQNSHFSAIYEAVPGLSTLLAMTPQYLQHLGLLTSNGKEQASNTYVKESLLLLMALRTLPKLPYYLAADLWRLEVLNNNVTNITDLNNSWRRFRRDMQRISIPTREEDLFDFLSDPYIYSNKPYLGKFYGIILQFQLLEQILDGIDIHDTEAEMSEIFVPNEMLKKLLQGGKSKKWMDLLDDEMEINGLDSGPLCQYFYNLETYLGELEILDPVRLTTLSTSTIPTLARKNYVNSTVENEPSETIVADEPVSDFVFTTQSSSNSTIHAISNDNSESKKQSSSGPVILFGCASVASVAIIVGFFVYGRRHFARSHVYVPTDTREV